MNPRIERYLCTLLVGAKGGWTGYAPLTEDDVEALVADARRQPAEIALLRELGLIDESEEKIWRERWDAMSAPFEPPAGSRERATAYLASIDPDHDEMRHMAALITYEELGLYEEPPGDYETGYSIPVSEPENQEPEADVALRVIPGPGASFRVAGVAVTDVVLYDDHLEVRWDFDRHAPDASAGTILRIHHHGYVERRGEVAIDRLTDDVGTEYRWEGGGYSMGTETAVGDARFEPAPPAGARELTVVVDGEPIKVLLA